MRIYKMKATFGKLEQAELSLEPGLNVIEAPNEWGKSTWCAFLLAMLYGLDSRAKTTKSALADKERYAPWSGSPMSGEITLCWQGRDITIQRYTRGRVPLGEFRAYETATGLAVPELTAHNCGEKLLGVERSVFCRAGFLRLSDLPVTQDEALRRRLNALVTTGDESGDGEHLGRELKDLRNRIRYNRSGLLPQAEAERETLEKRLEELTALEGKCRELETRLEETQKELSDLENHKTALAWTRAEAGAKRLTQAREEKKRAGDALQAMEAGCEKLPSRQEAEEKIHLLEAFRQEWEEVRQESARVPRMPEEPVPEGPFRGLTGPEALEQARQDALEYGALRDAGAVRYWWIPGTAVLTGAAVLFWLADRGYGFGALLVGLVLLGLGLAKRRNLQNRAGEYAAKYATYDPDLWLLQARKYADTLRTANQQKLAWQQSRAALDSRLLKLEKQKQSLCGEQMPEKVLEIWRQIIRKWELLDRARQEYLQAEGFCLALEETAVRAEPPAREDGLAYSEADTDRLLQDARELQRHLLGRLGQYQGRMEALGDRTGLHAALEKLENRIHRLQETYDALTLALDTLAEARRELQRRFAPRIAERAARLMEVLTGGRYDRLTLSEDLSLLAGTREEGVLQSPLWRSAGTVDQLYVSLRLAVAEELTPHAPLILDDALVRFDDIRLNAAMEILKTMAEKKQVILFTCQSRENKLL